MKPTINNAVMLPMSQLETNSGQIEGLPKNPRLIKGDKFKKLKQSIVDNPEMLSLRELLVYPIGGGQICYYRWQYAIHGYAGTGI